MPTKLEQIREQFDRQMDALRKDREAEQLRKAEEAERQAKELTDSLKGNTNVQGT